jgi:arylsulfatase A-like enzyme
VADRPNILWICTDQQRYDTIGALGNPHIHTPNLDRLVREGVAFTHAFCQSPICTPSRASFLTGRYPGAIRASTNGNLHWADAAPLVTKLLADSGYDCGLAGKLHLSGAQGRIEPRPDDGYRVFHWSHGPRDLWPEGHAYADWLRAQGYDLAEMQQNPEAIPPALHQTSWCADRAIEFLSADRTVPWLMSVNVFDPHPPFDPPDVYRSRYDADAMPDPLFRESDLAAQAALDDIDFQSTPRRPQDMDIRSIRAAYYAMIELIDTNVGRLLDALAATGQRENTLVIFMSDHGETLGDHGLLQKGCRFYEGLVRVPLIFSQPGVLPQGVIHDALVELTDLAPTLLDLAGGPDVPNMDGRSLLPLLRGEQTTHRDSVRTEYYRTLNPADFPGFHGSYATMIRTARHKLVVYHGHALGELFDLELDPGEFTNLWADPAYSAVRLDLLKHSFDALVLSLDPGPAQVTRF